jgi:hypothetical protein
MTGLKSRGPKPHRIARVLPELHALARRLELGQVSVLNDIYRLKNVELFDESDFADAVLAKEELA